MSDGNSGVATLALLLNQAHVLVERRRFAQARQVIAQGLKEYPENSELLYLGAFVDYSEDRNEEAMKAIQSVLARDPQHYGARRLCAHLHEEAKALAQAERLWIDLLREYPEDADCYCGYAELMLKTLNLEKAERLALEGLRHRPEHPGCLYVTSLANVIRGRRGADNASLAQLLAAHPEHVRSSLALVIALADRGENRAALRVAQELLRTRPESEHYVRLVRDLKMRSHWSLIPLYPMQRWGWGGAIAVTFGGIIGLQFARANLPAAEANILGFVWLAYVVYSWTWPQLLRKWL
jgi:tetratricopeptide (TPR) repeat protein